MQDAKREILKKVAAGEITAEEAAVELQAIDGETDPVDAPPQAPALSGRAARLRVEAGMGSVTVLGDESVLEAVADGPHRAQRDGDTLVIQNGDEQFLNSFVFGGRFGFAGKEHRLTVRVNPRLPLDADLQAGSLRIQGVRAPIKAVVQAGVARIDGFTEPLDLDIQAGSVRASGRLTGGRSKISCQAGKVDIELERGSSVKVSARTSLGRISLPGSPVFAGTGDASATTQVGDGEGTLDITSELGSVQVRVSS